MFEYLLRKSGTIEVLFRKLATSLGPLKRHIKRMIRSHSKSEISYIRNDSQINRFCNQLRSCGIKKGDIVIVHSSFDGLRSLGLNAEELVGLILELFSEMTVVFAAYPIEPLNKKDLYKYNPKKTLCWTGMLPNVFLKKPEVIRSCYPYNTLAAIGEHAERMMRDNLLAEFPHGEHTPWNYCMKQHAKILFLGTTSREANTMAIHMIPDIMGDEWPIKDWYERRTYRITLDNKIINKTIKIQRGFWYQFVNEYKTDSLLRQNKYLVELNVDNISIELVPDSYSMVEFLINRCKNRKLMYTIPNRYFKNN